MGKHVYQDILVFYFGEDGDRIAAVTLEGVEGERLIRQVEQKRLRITVEGVRLFPDSGTLFSPAKFGDSLFFVFPGSTPRQDLTIDSRAECRCAGVYRARELAESALEETLAYVFPETPLHVRELSVGWVSKELSLLLARAESEGRGRDQGPAGSLD